MTPAIRARYAYVRVTIATGDGIEVCGGVELRAGENLTAMYAAVRTAMCDALKPLTASVDDAQLAEAFERCVAANWPGRSYFCEVGRGYLDEYVQVWAPDGVDHGV